MGVVEFGGVETKPGEQTWSVLKAGKLASGTAVEIPVAVINGAEPGPCIYVQAACHGVEINGVEALRRLLEELQAAELKGTLIVVPAANILAFQQGTTNTPFDDENMNRVWPGKPDGNISSRMAHVLWENAIKHADYVVDLHTGYSTMATHTVFMEGRPECLELARVFGARILLMEEQDEEWEQEGFQGKLRNTATNAGIPAICPELGGRARFEEERIVEGLNGLRNTLKHFNMIEGEALIPQNQLIVRNHLTKVTTDVAGIFISRVEFGQVLDEGELLGEIYGLNGLKKLDEIEAPHRGCVISHTENPIVNTGSSLAMFGRVVEEDQQLLK
jgi:predicted deacylase